MVSGSIKGRNRGFGNLCIFSRLPAAHLVDITSPDVPILVNIVNLLVTLFFIFPVDHIIKCFTNPTELIIFLKKHHVDRFVQGLEVRDNPYESRQRKYGSERSWLVVDRFWQQHQRRWYKMLRDKEIKGLLGVFDGMFLLFLLRGGAAFVLKL